MDIRKCLLFDMKDCPPTCPVCDEKFSYRYKLQWHFQWRHGSKGRLFICTSCNRTFTDQVEFERHGVTHHRGIQYHMCEECGLCFRTDLELKKHQLKHKKVLSFECGQCFRTFPYSYGLSNHLKTHEEHAACRGVDPCRGCFNRRSFATRHPKNRKSLCNYLTCVGKKVCPHGKVWTSSL